MSSPATVRPAGPAPMTATFLPVAASTGGSSVEPSMESAAKRSRRPMETGSPLMPMTHLISHCFSWGQTRPQTEPRGELCLMTRAAPWGSPLTISMRKAGMSMLTGQPSMQAGCLHMMQRAASSLACSADRPRLTSSKLQTRSSGGWQAMAWRGIFIFWLGLMVFRSRFFQSRSVTGSFRYCE